MIMITLGGISATSNAEFDRIIGESLAQSVHAEALAAWDRRNAGYKPSIVNMLAADPFSFLSEIRHRAAMMEQETRIQQGIFAYTSAPYDYFIAPLDNWCEKFPEIYLVCLPLMARNADMLDPELLAIADAYTQPQVQ